MHMQQLLELDITTIQLRIKPKPHDAHTKKNLASQIKAAIQLANTYSAQLFINDYWELALEQGASGVHLGQDDLSDTAIDALQQAHCQVGITAHGYHEIARALAYQPNYLGLGPIFPTQSKHMPESPRGLTWLRYWCHVLHDKVPIVAIGGINTKNAAAVYHCGVSGIAVISALKQNPTSQTIALLRPSCVP